MTASDSADHGALLTIDLAALAENWRRLASIAAPAECAAVVKADAYGIGIENAVPALHKAGCRTFFVAHLSEAARVRALSAEATLYVLNGLPPGAAPRFHALKARPVLGSTEEIAEWQATASDSPAALHIDTGMNRLGLRPDGPLPERGARWLSLLMSHFSGAEDLGGPITPHQIALFRDLAARYGGVPASLANSAGTLRPERPHFNLVRPGYALYGGNPMRGDGISMRPVLRLDAPIVQVREVPAGERVGYNGLWRAERASRIAVISLGYADGFFRTTPARPTTAPPRTARIDGQPCPFIGSVSMDLIALDVTDRPVGAVRRGDRAILIDDGDLCIDAVGASAGTIGYEVLTNLGRRYRRRLLPA